MTAAYSNVTTIASVATPPGFGGIGIVRISGPKARDIAIAICHLSPLPRHAHYTRFHAKNGRTIDDGILLYFPAPRSFTGEDVVELQGHGGPVVLNHLLKQTYELGAAAAQPGEFSQRAFLNGRISLDQAEAIMSLIHASSEQAAQGAQKSLQGVFRKQVEALIDQLRSLRAMVEAALDFSEEDIDFLDDDSIRQRLEKIETTIHNIAHRAHSGQLLNEGIHAVIAGAPNVGKSSLLNRLSEQDNALVSNAAGTTRDVVRASILVDGLTVHLSDTAGLRESPSALEQQGMERSVKELQRADLVLIIEDATRWGAALPPPLAAIRPDKALCIVNKIDCVPNAIIPQRAVGVSAKTGEGIDRLKQALLKKTGFVPAESVYSVRGRHLLAITDAKQHVHNAYQSLANKNRELLAEDLKLATDALATISGKITSDALLGDIFSQFCIGK